MENKMNSEWEKLKDENEQKNIAADYQAVKL